MENFRLLKVEKSFKQALCEVLLTRMNHPIFKELVITEVKVAADLKSAKIYYFHSKKSEKEVLNAFLKAKNIIKRELSQRVPLKYLPEPKFYFDETYQQSLKLDQLFDQLEKEKT